MLQRSCGALGVGTGPRCKTHMLASPEAHAQLQTVKGGITGGRASCSLSSPRGEAERESAGTQTSVARERAREFVVAMQTDLSRAICGRRPLARTEQARTLSRYSPGNAL